MKTALRDAEKQAQVGQDEQILGGGVQRYHVYLKNKSQLFKRMEVNYQQMEKWAGLFKPATFEDLLWKPIDE